MRAVLAGRVQVVVLVLRGGRRRPLAEDRMRGVGAVDRGAQRMREERVCAARVREDVLVVEPVDGSEDAVIAGERYVAAVRVLAVDGECLARDRRELGDPVVGRLVRVEEIDHIGIEPQGPCAAGHRGGRRPAGRRRHEGSRHEECETRNCQPGSLKPPGHPAR